MSECVMWCARCGARLTAEQTEGASCCPCCGSTGLPCDPSDDFLIEVNWHELRILGIWASNWADKLDDGAQASLRGILSRLERQAPDRAPLTLGGELRQMRQAIATGELKARSVEAVGVPAEGFVQVNGPGAVGHSRRPGVAATVDVRQEDT